MHRLAWVVSLLALGCGSGSETGGADAGSDVADDVTQHCVVDFPCRVDWECTDTTHWVEMHSVSKPPCSGQTCESTGITHACDPGLECIEDPPSGSKVQCAYGGVDGCVPTDAGAFTPDAMAPAPSRQVGACDQVGIDQYWSRCLDPSTYDATACTYWQNNYKTCIACLVQTLAVAPWNVDNQSPAIVANTAGCFEFFGDTICASKVDANTQCAAAVCVAGCQLDAQAYAACIEAARTTACAAFPLCDADAGAYATCETPSLKDFVTGFGEALCGP